MWPIGFSTGAVARENFAEALRVLHPLQTDAIELSALRIAELAPLVAALDLLELRPFSHVSLHAPSAWRPEDERHVIALLERVAARGYLVIVHPDAMCKLPEWRVLGDRLCLENMDKRKLTGRTASELRWFFEQLPEASFCFDVAHARQVDGSMTEAYRLLREFGTRVRQVHISEVTTASRHARMSPSAAKDYAQVLGRVPADAAFIIEAQLPTAELSREMDAVRRLLAGLGRHAAVA